MKQHEEYNQREEGKEPKEAHISLGLLIGPGIDQQPHTVRVIIHSGTHQRRPSVLRVGLAAAHTETTPWQQRWQHFIKRRGQEIL
jgi:hypothetical protein